jgi:hypothetical protein
MASKFVMPGASPGRTSPLPGFGLSPGITILPHLPLHPHAKDGHVIRSSKFHLAHVRETYFQHFRAALGISARLATASAACALHAFVPGLCTRSASRRIAAIHARLASRSDTFEQVRHDASPFAARRPVHIDIESS